MTVVDAEDSEPPPEAWISAMHVALGEFSKPEVRQPWSTVLEESFRILAIFTNFPGAGDGFAVSARTVFDDVIPARLAHMFGPDATMDHLATTIGKKRGAGDDIWVPRLRGYELAGFALAVAEVENDSADQDGQPTWYSFYAVDKTQTFWVTRWLIDQPAVTQFRYMDPALDEASFQQLIDLDDMVALAHFRLLTLLFACLAPREHLVDRFGPDDVDEAAARGIAAMLNENPYDPRNPMRAN